MDPAAGQASGLIGVVAAGLEDPREFMAGIGWLARVPDAFRAEVQRRCSIMRFDAGAPIFHRGAPPAASMDWCRGR